MRIIHPSMILGISGVHPSCFGDTRCHESVAADGSFPPMIPWEGNGGVSLFSLLCYTGHVAGTSGEVVDGIDSPKPLL
jgi:hypothetical protein